MGTALAIDQEALPPPPSPLDSDAWNRASVEERKRYFKNVEALGEEIAAVSARIDAATFHQLELIREFDEKGGWGHQGAKTCAHWLSWRIGLDTGTAREKVRVARALGRLPRVAAAFRRGELSYSKVRAITRVAVEENEADLVELARNAAGWQLERIMRGYRRALQINEHGYLPVTDTERWVKAWSVGDGMFRVVAQVPADEAHLIVKALDAVRFAGNEAQFQAGRGSRGVSAETRDPMRSAEVAAPGGGDTSAGARAPVRTLEVVAPDPTDVSTETRGSTRTLKMVVPACADVSAETCAPDQTFEVTVPTEGDVSTETRAPARPLEVVAPAPADVSAETCASDRSAEVAALAEGGVSAETRAPARTPGVASSARGDVSTETRVPHPALDAASPTERDAATETPPRRGSRSPELTGRQRSFNRADALVALAESILQAPGILRTPTSPRHEVIVHVDADALRGKERGVATFDDGWAMPLAMAQRLACDAALVGAVIDQEGNVLDVGRRTRSIPPAIRRALHLRDRGCRFPGCPHTQFVDGHHIQHWAHGGETKLDNLILLCRHHHRLVHEEGFTLELRDGEPVFTSPTGRVIDEAPPRLKGLRPLQMNDYPSFLSWLEDLHPDGDLVTPDVPNCYPWDLELAVSILCQRDSGPLPEDTG